MPELLMSYSIYMPFLPQNVSGVMLYVVNNTGSTQLISWADDPLSGRVYGLKAWYQMMAYCKLGQNKTVWVAKSPDVDVEFFVAGFLKSQDAVFFSGEGYEVTLNQTGQWEIVDLSTWIPSEAKFVVLEIYGGTTGGSAWGARPYESTDNRTQIGNVGLNSIIVPCFDRKIEIYRTSSSGRMWLMGYGLAGDFRKNAIDKTPSGSGYGMIQFTSSELGGSYWNLPLFQIWSSSANNTDKMGWIRRRWSSMREFCTNRIQDNGFQFAGVDNEYKADVYNSGQLKFYFYGFLGEGTLPPGEPEGPKPDNLMRHGKWFDSTGRFRGCWLKRST